MAANPNCKDRETAEKVVNEVFDSCFKDTRPFDEVRFLCHLQAFVRAKAEFLQIY